MLGKALAVTDWPKLVMVFFFAAARRSSLQQSSDCKPAGWRSFCRGGLA
jgi:hypothetical protein